MRNMLRTFTANARSHISIDVDITEPSSVQAAGPVSAERGMLRPSFVDTLSVRAS
jgi:hypothetical protein